MQYIKEPEVIKSPIVYTPEQVSAILEEHKTILVKLTEKVDNLLLKSGTDQDDGPLEKVGSVIDSFLFPSRKKKEPETPAGLE